MRGLVLIAGCFLASPALGQTSGIVKGVPYLYYESLGHGTQTIVVLHGGPGLAHDYMRPEWDRLAASGRIIYYDQNGCGRSARVPPYGWRSHVADLDRLLHALAPDKRVILAGSSWGSLLSLAYAYNHPERVEALIVSGVPFGHANSTSQSATSWVAPSKSRLDSVDRGLPVGPATPRPLSSLAFSGASRKTALTWA
jgi:pimeloyl-ACP methyl ester carboxylesterase